MGRRERKRCKISRERDKLYQLVDMRVEKTCLKKKKKLMLIQVFFKCFKIIQQFRLIPLVQLIVFGHPITEQ